MQQLESLQVFRIKHFRHCHAPATTHKCASLKLSIPHSDTAFEADLGQDNGILLDNTCQYNIPFVLSNFGLEERLDFAKLDHSQPTDAMPWCESQDNVDETKYLRIIIPQRTQEQLQICPVIKSHTEENRGSVNVHFHCKHINFLQRIETELCSSHDTSHTVDIRNFCRKTAQNC